MAQSGLHESLSLFSICTVFYGKARPLFCVVTSVYLVVCQLEILFSSITQSERLNASWSHRLLMPYLSMCFVGHKGNWCCCHKFRVWKRPWYSKPFKSSHFVPGEIRGQRGLQCELEWTSVCAVIFPHAFGPERNCDEMKRKFILRTLWQNKLFSFCPETHVPVVSMSFAHNIHGINYQRCCFLTQFMNWCVCDDSPSVSNRQFLIWSVLICSLKLWLVYQR